MCDLELLVMPPTKDWLEPRTHPAYGPVLDAAVIGNHELDWGGDTMIARMREWGAAGVGQSSWGPAVYGIVGDAGTSADLADRVRAAVPHGAADVYEGPFSHTGARVWVEP